ncbi:MAG: hypothetical protein WB729_18210 [Candidatus Sulfotelmatobacter sp.]
MLEPILRVLDNAKVSGSLEFSEPCDWRDFPHFPQFRSQTADSSKPIQALREILADDPKMRVSQEPNGTIRMTELGVPTDLLNLRIRHISFHNDGKEPQDTYEPNQALRAILTAPEVAAFMQAHAIRGGGSPFVGEGIVRGVGGPVPNLPHISGSLDNVTISQALDYVLQTFPGVWIYEDCPGSGAQERAIYFRFFYLRNIGSGTFVEG